MNSDFNPIRYEQITEKNPREILMLRGRGCAWRRCTFCDYHLDFSRDDRASYELNFAEIAKVTGEYERLEVINSGSFTELDKQTIAAILEKCLEKNIRYLHVEMHWIHKDDIHDLRTFCETKGIHLHIKMGVETFDTHYRDDILQKGMNHALPEEIQPYADDICLLFGLTGQTKETMLQDIKIGLALFNRVCINIMVDNSTKVKPDNEVIAIFREEIYPLYIHNPRVDILMNNTDFGVGGDKNDQ